MRKIKTDWTKAQWLRAANFTKAEKFGVELDTQKMNPFKFSHTSTDTVTIMMKNIFIGEMRQMTRQLLVRDEYPADHDNVIKRAVRALCEVNDEVARLERALKRQQSQEFQEILTEAEYTPPPAQPEAAAPLLGVFRERQNDPNQPVRIEFASDLFKKAMHGLINHKDVTSVWTNPHAGISLKMVNPWEANDDLTIGLSHDDGHILVSLDYCEISVDMDAFLELLHEGVQMWDEKMNADDLIRDLAHLSALPAVDTKTLVFKMKPSRDAIRHVPVPMDNAPICGFTLAEKAYGGSCLCYNGQCLMDSPIVRDGTFLNEPYNGPEIPGVDLNEPANFAALLKVRDLLMCRKAGINPEDIPAFDVAKVSRALEKEDMGYFF